MLTDRTRQILEIALTPTRRSDVDEIEEALDAPAALSERAKSLLEIAIAQLKDAEEIIAAIETGSTALSDRAKLALEIALADQKAFEEILEKIES
jgi:hypothetical protein